MTPAYPEPLNELDRRIVAALQVDGRAPWRQIAAVLGEPERTVARRGARLLDTGLVEIHGLIDPHRDGRGDPFIARFRCAPGATWTAATSIANRPETVIASILFGSADCFADMWCPQHRLSDLFLHELASTPGLVSSSISPVLRYVTTIHDWTPGILQDSQVAQLRPYPLVRPWPPTGDAVPLGREERVITRALARDGRMAYDQLGRLVGVSEQTARRKVEALRSRWLLAIRAVVDPTLLGLPVGALLWIKTAPRKVAKIEAALHASHHVRYGAVLVGEFQLVADVRLPSKADLYNMLTTAPWLELTDSIETSLVLDTLKQSDVLTRRLRAHQ